MTNKDNKIFQHIRKCISKIDGFGRMTITPSMYPRFINPLLGGIRRHYTVDCFIKENGDLVIDLIEFISVMDDYDAVEKALLNYFKVDDNE